MCVRLCAIPSVCVNVCYLCAPPFLDQFRSYCTDILQIYYVRSKPTFQSPASTCLAEKSIQLQMGTIFERKQGKVTREQRFYWMSWHSLHLMQNISSCKVLGNFHATQKIVTSHKKLWKIVIFFILKIKTYPIFFKHVAKIYHHEKN